MNISLSEGLKELVDPQVGLSVFGVDGEHARELIRKDKGWAKLRRLLLAGAQSPPAAAVDVNYFDTLRKRIQGQKSK